MSHRTLVPTARVLIEIERANRDLPHYIIRVRRIKRRGRKWTSSGAAARDPFASKTKGFHRRGNDRVRPTHVRALRESISARRSENVRIETTDTARRTIFGIFFRSDGNGCSPLALLREMSADLRGDVIR